MGLNATGGLDLKGCVIDLYQRHCKHVVPFVVSSEGYGLLWNNPSLGRVEFGNNMTRWVSRGCRQLDYYITAGDSYADIMGNYAGVTGHAPLLPKWAAGFWMCKLRYRTQGEFLAAAREFKRLGLPLSVLVIDFRHWRHWGDWQLDPEFWPDPVAMVRELDEMGARIMISPWVMVEENSENFAEFHRRGLYVKGPGGTEAWWPGDPPGTKPGHPADRPRGRTLQYDPTHPDAGPFLWERWKRNYVDLGIRTFWLDPCDDLSLIADYDKVRYHAGPGVEANCFYPVAHQKTVHDGLRAAGEAEVVTICRSSWAGSQRYGASPAAHDIASSFAHLREYLMAGLNLAMAGIPWGAAEIGGFVSPEVQDDEFRELVVRWYQYGVFTPIFRTHGYRDNNEPWNIGGDTYPHVRAAIMLRERLRPYVLAQMKVAAERGIPPMRPLFFDFEEDARAAEVEDQFLFGPDLLVAPIVQYRARERRVYLPAGAEWSDAWSGEEVHEGGVTITAPAPLERIRSSSAAGTAHSLRCSRVCTSCRTDRSVGADRELLRLHLAARRHRPVPAAGRLGEGRAGSVGVRHGAQRRHRLRGRGGDPRALPRKGLCGSRRRLLGKCRAPRGSRPFVQHLVGQRGVPGSCAQARAGPIRYDLPRNLAGVFRPYRVWFIRSRSAALISDW